MRTCSLDVLITLLIWRFAGLFVGVVFLLVAVALLVYWFCLLVVLIWFAVIVLRIA